jgi:hypothetical protein
VVKFLTKDFWNHSAVRIIAAQGEAFVQNKQFLRDRMDNIRTSPPDRWNLGSPQDFHCSRLNRIMAKKANNEN